MLKEFNPRIHYREVEYSAVFIFTKILEHWHIDIPVQSCIDIFWEGLKLEVEIYSDTLDVLQKLKENGYVIATLTDLPNAMPDENLKGTYQNCLAFSIIMFPLLLQDIGSQIVKDFK